MADLFRKSALEKLSSPDQLDQMIVITSPMSWLAAAGGFIIVAAVLLWGMFGRLTRTVEAEGILLGKGETAEAVCYVPLETGAGIAEGMRVVLTPVIGGQESGRMEGVVTFVDSYMTSRESMAERLGDEKLTELFLQNGPVVEVVCSLKQDENTMGGSAASVTEGALLTADIITESKAPIALLVP